MSLNQEQQQRMKQKLEVLQNITNNLPMRQNPQANRQREILFRNFDPHKKGYISFVDIQNGIKEVIQSNILFQANQAILRAFQDSKKLQTHVIKLQQQQEEEKMAQDKNYKPEITEQAKKLQLQLQNIDCLGKQGFLFFLLFLARYLEIFFMYQLIDTDENDGILMSEFLESKDFFSAWGYKLENPEQEFKKNNQNMSGNIFFSEFIDWAEKRKLKLLHDTYVIDTLYHLEQRFHFKREYNKMMSSASNLDNFRSQEETENEYFKVKLLNKDSSKTLQLRKKVKNKSLHQTMNNSKDNVQEQQQSQNQSQIDIQNSLNEQLETQIQEQFQKLNSQQQIMIQENFFLKQIAKSLLNAQNILDDKNTSISQQNIQKEKIKILKKQEQNIKTKIIFELAEQNELNSKILSFIYNYYKERDTYNKAKRQVQFETLSNKQFLNFAQDFNLKKHIKMEAVKKILNFNQDQPTKPGLSFQSFSKAIEMIGAYIFSDQQDSHVEVQQNLQQVYQLLGFYNNLYRKYMGLSPSKKNRHQYQDQSSSQNYTKFLDETMQQSQTVNIKQNSNVNNSQISQSLQLNLNNISNINNSSSPNYLNSKDQQSQNQKSNRSKKSSHGFSLPLRNPSQYKKSSQQQQQQQQQQNIIQSNNNILPIYETNMEAEMSYQSLKLSDVSDVSDHNNVNTTIEQIITSTDRKQHKNNIFSQQQQQNNNNNFSLIQSNHNISNDYVLSQQQQQQPNQDKNNKQFTQEQQEQQTIQNVKFFTKMMIPGQNDQDKYDDDTVSEHALDENPFLYLDSMLNQRKKIKEIFYFYTKQKHGFTTFDSLSHEINVFSLGQFSQFCRQFNVLRDQRKSIPNIFKKAGKMSKELQFEEFIELLNNLGVKHFENEKSYKTREEKILAFYNYLGFDIKNSFRKKLVPIKKPFNIDVEDGFRLLQRDKLRYSQQLVKKESIDLQSLQQQHNEEMRRLFLKQQEEGRKKLLRQIELQELELKNKNKHRNRPANGIIKANYFDYSNEKGLQRTQKQSNLLYQRNSKSQTNIRYVKKSVPSIQLQQQLQQQQNISQPDYNSNNLYATATPSSNINSTRKSISKSIDQSSNNINIHNSKKQSHIILPNIHNNNNIIQQQQQPDNNLNQINLKNNNEIV